MPNGPDQIDPVRLRRFEAKVTYEPMSGCHLWTGAIWDDGYGQVVVGQRAHGPSKARAHRLAWEMERGPIPDGLYVCHRCDTRLCVNVAHLFLGTQVDNMRDMHSKGRGWRRRLLTAEQVITVRSRRLAGERPVALAREFRISRTTVWEIASGRKRAGG